MHRPLRCESARVHITVPQRCKTPAHEAEWIVIHRGTLSPSDVTTHEGLPVTTVAKSVLDVMDTTGRLGLARQAIKDAREEGYISAAEANRITRQLNQYAHDRCGVQATTEHVTA